MQIEQTLKTQVSILAFLHMLAYGALERAFPLIFSCLGAPELCKFGAPEWRSGLL